MEIVMLQTMPGESINGGRTTQAFVQGRTYPVPDPIGQLWIGRGWATAARGETRGTSERRAAEPVSPVSQTEGKE